MVDHLIQQILVSFGRHLGMTCLGSSRFRSLLEFGRMAQNAVQAAVASFDDVTELMVARRKVPKLKRVWA